jgi:hypothetical protein
MKISNEIRVKIFAKYLGEKDVYNLTAGTTHTYIANGIITHNTGGDMEKGTVDFEDMFYDPESYNMIAVENKWDEDLNNTFCSYYFPDKKNKDGFERQNDIHFELN